MTLGVTLDVDDTLYCERDYVASGFAAVDRRIRSEHGVVGFGDVAQRLFAQGIRGDVFDRALTELGIEPAPDLVAELVGWYRTHRPDIRLAADAEAFLGLAHEREHHLAVITDGPAASQWAKVRALGLEARCAPIVVTEEHRGGRPKPDPSAYQHVQESVGLPAAAMVYVGDNPGKDFVAPHRLGWRTIRIRRPCGLHAAVSSGADVDVEVTDLEELRELLEAG